MNAIFHWSQLDKSEQVSIDSHLHNVEEKKHDSWRCHGKKHGKHGSHHRVVFFPSVILAGFLLLMNFKSAHFFHTHGFTFSENSEASKDMIFPTSTPPAWYWIYWSLTRKCLLASSTFQVRGDFHWKNPNKWWVDRSVSRKHLRQCRPSILGKPESRRMRCKKRISQPQSGSTNNWGWVPRDV